MELGVSILSSHLGIIPAREHEGSEERRVLKGQAERMKWRRRAEGESGRQVE